MSTRLSRGEEFLEAAERVAERNWPASKDTDPEMPTVTSDPVQEQAQKERIHWGSLLGKMVDIRNWPGMFRGAVESVQKISQGKREEIGDALTAPPAALVSAESVTKMLEEQREILKVMSAEFIPQLTIRPEERPEESPILRETGSFYTENLIPDPAFYHLTEDGQENEFLSQSRRGGMLNRWVPTPMERALYPPNYETVRDQVYADMTGKPPQGAEQPRPGIYRMSGLRSPEGALVAYLTYRLPPDDPTELQRYIEHIKAHLQNVQNREVNFLDDATLEQYAPHMMEIDTINVKEGWKRGGIRLLLETLQQIASERGERTPEHIYYYRYGGLRPLSYQPGDGEPRTLSGDPVEVGGNDASWKLLSGFGFRDIGFQLNDHEVVVREVPNLGGTVTAQPKWIFGLQKNYERALDLGEGCINEALRK